MQKTVNSNRFRKTRAIRRLRQMRKRIRVVQGGTSAGKTYGIIPILIDRAIKTELLEVSVISETMPHLKKGAIKDFKKIMKQTGRWKRSHWHESDKKYTFSNGSVIEFFSVDDDSKVRGPRRNVLYVNEANNIKWETFYQLLIRSDMEVYIDFNPVGEFWAHTELLPKKNVEFLKLTYKDNDALSKTIVRELESNLVKAYFDKSGDYDNPDNIKNEYWANWCKVYLRGQIGSLQGAVYTNWVQKKQVPPDALLLGYGLDFGYSNDPTALVAVYRYNGEIYVDQLIYQRGLKTPDLVKEMNRVGVDKEIMIYCDSSEPKTRDEIREYGFSILGALKGPDSIKHGIDVVQSYRLNIIQNSTDLINELRNYCWLKDKSGRTLNKPIDAYNHGLDALRYFFSMALSQKKENGEADVEYYD